MIEYKNILFCADFSEDANIAFLHALDLAKKYKAKEGGVIWVVRKNGHHAMVRHSDGWWVDPTDGTWCKPLKNATALYPYVED